MVFQSIALYPHKTVYENIAFPLRMARRPRSEVESRVRSVAHLLKIDAFLDRRPHQLSGGQRQRVALGRAVVRDPAVFLFDEPLSALDAKLRVEMRVEIKKLHERLGATFVYVTHDQVEALTMADRVAVMDAGRLQQYASPDEVYNRPANMTVARSVGSPSMNLVPGLVSEEDGILTFRAKGLALKLSGPIVENLRSSLTSEVVIGVRPEGALLNGGGDGGAGSGWVYATEPVGSDLFVDISFDEPDGAEGELFKGRTRPDLKLRSGERVSVSLPPESLFVFDRSGHRLHPRDSVR
jgi:multiple sugar transport system ATP-binding protein